MSFTRLLCFSDASSKLKRGGDERAAQTVPIVRQDAEEETNKVSAMKWNRSAT